MTVKELIEKLSEHDEDALVFIPTTSYSHEDCEVQSLGYKLDGSIVYLED